MEHLVQGYVIVLVLLNVFVHVHTGGKRMHPYPSRDDSNDLICECSSKGHIPCCMAAGTRVRKDNKCKIYPLSRDNFIKCCKENPDPGALPSLYHCDLAVDVEKSTEIEKPTAEAIPMEVGNPTTEGKMYYTRRDDSKDLICECSSKGHVPCCMEAGTRVRKDNKCKIDPLFHDDFIKCCKENPDHEALPSLYHCDLAVEVEATSEVENPTTERERMYPRRDDSVDFICQCSYKGNAHCCQAISARVITDNKCKFDSYSRDKFITCCKENPDPEISPNLYQCDFAVDVEKSTEVEKPNTEGTPSEMVNPTTEGTPSEMEKPTTEGTPSEMEKPITEGTPSDPANAINPMCICALNSRADSCCTKYSAKALLRDNSGKCELATPHLKDDFLRCCGESPDVVEQFKMSMGSCGDPKT